MKWRRYGTSLLLLLSLVGCASKPAPTWRAADIESQNSSAVSLVHEGKPLAMVNREQIKRLREIKDRLEKVMPGVRADLFVLVDAAANAYASNPTDGGVPTISITTGMIDLLGWDDDAFAAVLGHEFAHIALRHGQTRQQRRVVGQAASTALGFLLSAAGVPLGGTVADVGVTAVERVYSRDEESHADRQGFGYLVAAGFDPAGGVRLWEKMQAAQGKSSGFSIPFLATHPVSQERITAMEKLATEQAKSPTK
jgi:predicted Zn-dependent protease